MSLNARLPIKVNANARGHRMAQAAKVKAQRRGAEMVIKVHPQLGAYLSQLAIGGRLEVMLTRVAPRELDSHDNLRTALKPVVDGIADALGLRSDRDPRVAWHYSARRDGAEEYAVEIKIYAVAGEFFATPNAAQPEQPMAKANKKPTKTGPERTLSRTKHDLPVKLTKDGMVAAGVKLAALLGDQGAFDREAKETKAAIKSREDALQARVDEAAAVIRSGEEIRKVEVEIRADFKAGKVVVVRMDTEAVVTTRTLSDDERQQKMVFDQEELDDAADEAVKKGEPPLDTKSLWNLGHNGEERSPLPDGQP